MALLCKDLRLKRLAKANSRKRKSSSKSLTRSREYCLRVSTIFFSKAIDDLKREVPASPASSLRSFLVDEKCNEVLALSNPVLSL